MKKLSIVCGVMLVLGLMAGPAFPLSYELDFQADGSFETGGTVNIDPLGMDTTEDLDIYLDGYSCAPDDKVFGVSLYVFIDDLSCVQVNSFTPNTDVQMGGPADDSLSFFNDLGGGLYALTVSNFNFMATTGQLLLGRMGLECTCSDLDGTNIYAENDITDKTNQDPSANDGFVADCNLASVYPSDGALVLTQAPPPCECSLSPDPANVDSGSSVQITVSETGDCQQNPVYVWSDDCVNGDVDQSGLFTAGVTLSPESCQVCVTDTANGVGCCAAVNISPQVLCAIEVYEGGTCETADPIPYNRPGRRGLALTCGDQIDFCYCTDCDPNELGQNDPCPVWSISPEDVPTGTTLVDNGGFVTLVVGSGCDALDYPVDVEVIVTDPCNNNITDSVVVQIGKVVLDVGNTNAHPGSQTADVCINLINPDHHVKGIQLDLGDCDGGNDNMVCTECIINEDRATQFTCSANELPDGTCRVVLWTTNPAALIQQGEGDVLCVKYDVGKDMGSKDCVCLWPFNRKVSDQFLEDLCTCGETGQVCFRICGDVYPQDCPECTTCGDGVVDLFDILEEIDIVLGIQNPTTCQMMHGDVPNGMPPYCGNPAGSTNCDNNGVIDIFDALVVIDKALGRLNCCDYCMFGEIF